MRTILHIDMDAFFAAVEVLDHPRLAGKPVIVGGTPEGHGVVATASYEARRFGVRSAMPAAEAVRLCPHGIFLRPRMGRYAAVSRQVFALFRELSPLVEPVSIDEAFIDVSGCLPLAAGAPAARSEAAAGIALELQRRVKSATGGLTCSIGVAENKFLAKVASDLRKPEGLVAVAPGEAEMFLAPLAIERLWGVGPRTAERLHRFGLVRIGDVARLGRESLEALAGVELGRHLHELARGIDERPVSADGEARSVSQEVTLAVFISPRDRGAIDNVLFALAEGVAGRLRGEGLWGRTVTLKVRDERFETRTRSRTLAAPAQLVEEIFAAASRLFAERVELGGRRVRLLGVAVSGLTRAPVRQLDLFDTALAERRRGAEVARLLDQIRARTGDDSITRARLLDGPEGEDRGS